MMSDWGHFGGWGMGFGIVFMVLFWALVVLGIAALIRWLSMQSSPGRGARDKTPLEIVQERYARVKSTGKNTSRRSTTWNRVSRYTHEAQTLTP